MMSLFMLLSLLLSSCSFVYTYQEAYKVVDTYKQKNDYNYECIKTLLDRYRRPFTLLELGTEDGCLSLCSAHDYNATAVMLSNDGNRRLLNNCCRANLDNVILLDTQLNYGDLHKLAECEHVDVVLLTYGLHKFLALKSLVDQGWWSNALEDLMNLGDHYIVACDEYYTDPTEDACMKDVRNYLEKKRAVLIGQIEINGKKTDIYWYTHNKLSLHRVHWNSTRRLGTGEYIVRSGFDSKHLYKVERNVTSLWHKGINLRTYKGLFGSYPLHKDILNKLKKFKHVRHNDLNPCNFVIQGKNLVLIDFDDPRRNAKRKVGFARCMHLFD